jgi:two-component system, OmpR family, phosphate regulon sensor histidine kinase PhoR
MTVFFGVGSLLLGLLVGIFIGRKRWSVAGLPEVSNSLQSSPSLVDLLDGIDAGVIVLGPDDLIENINHVAQQMLNSANILPGESMDRTTMGADMLAILSGPAQSNHSIEMSVEPDRVVQVRVTHRSTGGAVFVMYDITELKHLELMRSDFVANVSHELRTPVSVIRANAETLLDGALGDTEVAHEFVAAIHRNSERITNLVSDLLDLARLEAGSVSLVLTEIDMSKVVARTIGGVRTIADGQDITIHNALADEILCLGDEDAVEQVLTNLIENAIKYGHANGNVWVRSYQTPGRIRIEVIDDGAGIEAIHRTRLFERFYRVDKGRSRASGGTGLGLSIVKHLITSMNGEVGMEPNRPTGSVFWLTLPASQTDPSFVAPA